MEEACEAGSKNLPKNFRGFITFLGKEFFSLFLRLEKF